MKNPIARWSVLLMVGFLCLAGPAAAQAPKISAVVDRTQATIGESLKLEVQISGGGGEVDVSRIPHFKVLSRGQSTNVSIVNGRMERTETYAFTLIPEREGRLTIPPLPVRVDGREYPTEPIMVTVKPRSAVLENEAHDVFVRAEVQPQPLFDGQPGVYTFKFYQAVQVANARYQAPEF
ncbi:MAG: BatD family protein, partial [Desulfococcaceae bacterium]